MATQGQHTHAEILSQGTAWQEAIEAVQREREPLRSFIRHHSRDGIVFIGCGSTHCLAQYAAPFFQRITHIPCRGLPSSEVAFQTDAVVVPGRQPLVVALSRSGQTSETILAVRKLRRAGCEALAVSCYDHTGLSETASMTVGIPEGREESYAQTRSFAAMLVAVQMLASIAVGNRTLAQEIATLPEAAEDIVMRARVAAQPLAQDLALARISYLASGALYGLAAEAMIKVKEMSLSTAEAFHFMEFRHGPMALVDEQHLIVGLLSVGMRSYELAVLRDLKARGARVAVVANRQDGLGAEFDLVFPLGVSVLERARGVLYLPFVQWLAYHRALARGLNPDRPRHVVMAIRLDGTEMKG